MPIESKCYVCGQPAPWEMEPWWGNRRGIPGTHPECQQRATAQREAQQQAEARAKAEAKAAISPSARHVVNALWIIFVVIPVGAAILIMLAAALSH